MVGLVLRLSLLFMWSFLLFFFFIHRYILFTLMSWMLGFSLGLERDLACFQAIVLLWLRLTSSGLSSLLFIKSFSSSLPPSLSHVWGVPCWWLWNRRCIKIVNSHLESFISTFVYGDNIKCSRSPVLFVSLFNLSWILAEEICTFKLDLCKFPKFSFFCGNFWSAAALCRGSLH